MCHSIPSWHRRAILYLYACRKSLLRRNFQTACMSFWWQWAKMSLCWVSHFTWKSFISSWSESGKGGMYARCFVTPEFGWHRIYFERLPKSMYISHILAVPKATRCIASDQNMRPMTTFFHLHDGLSVSVHWILSCLFRKTLELYILVYMCSLFLPFGSFQNNLKEVRWNYAEIWLLNASLINVRSCDSTGLI